MDALDVVTPTNIWPFSHLSSLIDHLCTPDSGLNDFVLKTDPQTLFARYFPEMNGNRRSVEESILIESAHVDESKSYNTSAFILNILLFEDR